MRELLAHLSSSTIRSAAATLATAEAAHDVRNDGPSGTALAEASARPHRRTVPA